MNINFHTGWSQPFKTKYLIIQLETFIKKFREDMARWHSRLLFRWFLMMLLAIVLLSDHVMSTSIGDPTSVAVNIVMCHTLSLAELRHSTKIRNSLEGWQMSHSGRIYQMWAVAAEQKIWRRNTSQCWTKWQSRNFMNFTKWTLKCLATQFRSLQKKIFTILELLHFSI